MGRLVPCGEPWRLGANEATVVHLPFDANVAGVPVEAGAYSLYAVPGEESWEIVVNEETRRWGHDNVASPPPQALQSACPAVPRRSTLRC